MQEASDVEDFCRRLRPRIVGALTLHCGDLFLAEELAQETLARVWQRWGQVERMTSPEGWTLKVAFNLANSQLRRRGAERRANARHGSRRSDVASSPDLADAMAIRTALQRLPQRQRQAVVLRYFADLSVESTARAMGCAEGTVRALTHQAVTSLREQMVDIDVDEVARDA